MNDVSAVRKEILHAAEVSPLARTNWHQRGRAPIGYVKGMALAYGLALSNYRQGERFAQAMADKAGADPKRDALAYYAPEFAALGLDCKTAGQDTLRHLFTLMTGLGMRESSGRACEGRDQSANNLDAETAEAGLFQCSFNLRHADPLLPQLFEHFKGSSELLDVFMEGVKPRPGELTDIGSGDGQEFQHLTKHCPAFAVAFAAVGLRRLPFHWGPVRRKEAQLRPEAEALFRDVEAILDTQGGP